MRDVQPLPQVHRHPLLPYILVPALLVLALLALVIVLTVAPGLLFTTLGSSLCSGLVPPY